jgi:hypothetical protein
LTNNKKDVIINVSKEREVVIMTKLVYLVTGGNRTMEVPTLAIAKELCVRFNTTYKAVYQPITEAKPMGVPAICNPKSKFYKGV